jgi:hypothetical protein
MFRLTKHACPTQCTFVIPSKAGIQAEKARRWSLDSRLRGMTKVKAARTRIFAVLLSVRRAMPFP